MNSYTEINRLLVLRAEKNRTKKMLFKPRSTAKSYEDEDASETRHNQRDLQTTASLVERQRVDSDISMSSSGLYVLRKYENTNKTPETAKSIISQQSATLKKQQHQSDTSSLSGTSVNTRKKLEPLIRKSSVNKSILPCEAERAYKSSDENLKRIQRNQIYALNQLMTKLEHDNFLKFCLENNIDPHGSN